MYTRRMSIVLSLLLIFVLGVMALASATTTLAQGQAGTTLSAYKSADGFWERRITWTIDKSAAPAELNLSCGDSADVTYTIAVAKTVHEVAGVRGQICVTNGGDRPTENLKLFDRVLYKTGAGQFQPLEGATWTLEPAQLAPGETQCYDYEITFTPVPGALYKNEVQVTITNHSGWLGTPFGPSPDASFSLPGMPAVSGPESITVNDSQGGSWTFSNSGSASYTRTFRCPENAGTHTNRATIFETGQYDEATVTVYCEPCPTPTPPPTPQMGQWCSPGYWRQEHHLDSWEATGYKPTDYYNAVIGSYGPQVPGNPTLWEVLQNPKKYARTGAYNAVADLLSWAHPDVNFTGQRTDYCPLN